MKKFVYYLLWIILILAAMLCAALILGELFGYDSVGVKGGTAAAGLGMIYSRKSLFKFFDKILRRSVLK